MSDFRAWVLRRVRLLVSRFTGMPVRMGPQGHQLPWALLLVGVIVGLLVLAIGIAIAIAGPLAIGLFVIVCVPLGWILALTQVVLIRRSAGSQGSAAAAAQDAPPVPGQDRVAAAASRRWTGGVNVPAATGRVSGTFQVGELELTGGTLVFRIRARTFQRLFGTQTLNVTVGARVTIFPVKRLLDMGVAIQPQGQEVWYFWTSSGPEILTALGDAGFEISAGRPGPRR
jgi:hypothetical protein